MIVEVVKLNLMQSENDYEVHAVAAAEASYVH